MRRFVFVAWENGDYPNSECHKSFKPKAAPLSLGRYDSNLEDGMRNGGRGGSEVGRVRRYTEPVDI